MFFGPRGAALAGNPADLGFQEIIYTTTGPDVARELRGFASAHREPKLAP